MRGSDYVVKRLFFAVTTVFVAVTLNLGIITGVVSAWRRGTAGRSSSTG